MSSTVGKPSKSAGAGGWQYEAAIKVTVQAPGLGPPIIVYGPGPTVAYQADWEAPARGTPISFTAEGGRVALGSGIARSPAKPPGTRNLLESFERTIRSAGSAKAGQAPPDGWVEWMPGQGVEMSRTDGQLFIQDGTTVVDAPAVAGNGKEYVFDPNQYTNLPVQNIRFYITFTTSVKTHRPDDPVDTAEVVIWVTPPLIN